MDPLALGNVTVQVRDLLRFHQRVGLTYYPQKEQLRTLFSSPFPGNTEPRRRPETAASRQKARQPRISMAGIREDIARCEQCMTTGSRRGQVLGSGSDHPRLMVVGDFPSQGEGASADEHLFGAAEDSMLRRMMEAIRLSMDEVYICNVVKCIPPEGQPDRECARCCFFHLKREIAALRPACILAMGESAAALLTGSSAPLVRLRGRFYSYAGAGNSPVRIMPTFHPRFLLQHAEMKQMVWQDLQMVQRQLNR
ncbi:MAG TPA: hypothetical protein ENK84_11345 [Desulfobulbus sp.]|nr:hypothetical protein [Desulfobulbus sp.]